MNNVSPSNYIFEYIRRGKNNRAVGVVVASRQPSGKVCFGWSLCNTNRGDTFNKERGLQMALGRCNHTIDPMPQSVLPHAEKLAARALRYFKDGTFAAIRLDEFGISVVEATPAELIAAGL